MVGNKVVVYQGPGRVSVESTDYPKLEIPAEVADAFGIKRTAPHAISEPAPIAANTGDSVTFPA